MLPQLLFLFGLGFLAANLKVSADLAQFQRRRREAVLLWRPPKPRFYGFSLLLAAVLGLLLAAKLVQRRPPTDWFGEAMMLVYYGCVFPLSTRIARGFYGEGVWTDAGFMPWTHISAVTWREDAGVALVLISRRRALARRLSVPASVYGEARRVLREKIKSHDIQIGGSGLDLGSRDPSDAI